ncbi:MAG: hypothetical protein IPK10_16315 [Bacteroidetes bacterium]|nr:hypothetical protein [Bacteroidota bacterium]
MDELWFADDTGMAIYNLHKDVTQFPKDKSHLIQLISNKTIRLQIINEKKITDDEGKSIAIGQAIHDLFGNRHKHFTATELNINNSFHHMALFLKKVGKVPKDEIEFKHLRPMFGIYFFKPGTKNRINPVYFECCFDHHFSPEGHCKKVKCNDLNNLNEMKQLFLLQLDTEKKIDYDN